MEVVHKRAQYSKATQGVSSTILPSISSSVKKLSNFFQSSTLFFSASRYCSFSMYIILASNTLRVILSLDGACAAPK